MTIGVKPLGVSEYEKVVLFDGVCKLCNAWARFLIHYDKQRIFKLASVQSAQGQAILIWYGLPTDYFETMVLVDEGVMYKKSTAFIRVMRRLPWPWFLLASLALLPRPVRDWLYDRIALNRYALFGKYDVCLLPSADYEDRYLND